MQLFVKDNKLRSALEDERTCKKQYGSDMAKKIDLRIKALRAALSLADFWPPYSGPERCHELKGDLVGTFSMDVKQPYRLLFIPYEQLSSPPSNEGERWKEIKAIQILRIEDTHG